MPPALFSRCLRAYAGASRACNRAGNRAHAKTRAELAASVTRLYGARRAAFGEEDVRTALVVADALARAPETWAARRIPEREAQLESRPIVRRGGDATRVPRARREPRAAGRCRHGRGAVPARAAPTLVVRGGGGEGGRGTSEPARRRRSRRNPRRRVTRSARAACAAFANMYRDARVPADDRAATFGAATRALGAAMATRGKGAGAGGASGSETLWRSATRAMAVAMAHGLPAVHKYASAVRGIEEAWGAVSDAFETLLLGSRGDGRRRGDFVKSPSESPSESPPGRSSPTKRQSSGRCWIVSWTPSCRGVDPRRTRRGTTRRRSRARRRGG